MWPIRPHSASPITSGNVSQQCPHSSLKTFVVLCNVVCKLRRVKGSQKVMATSTGAWTKICQVFICIFIYQLHAHYHLTLSFTPALTCFFDNSVCTKFLISLQKTFHTFTFETFNFTLLYLHFDTLGLYFDFFYLHLNFCFFAS